VAATDQVLVPVTRIELVQPPAVVLPTQVIGSRAGDSTATFDWDEATRDITQATSSRTLAAGAPTELLTNLDFAQDAIGTEVVLRNLSETERIAVNGTLGLEVQTPTGTTRLTSDPVDVVLEPGGEVTADFSFLLPSGTYSVRGFLESGAK
jgi:hypothetical protein